MKILSIETSCDETAVSILDARGTIQKPRFKLLGNALFSQVKLHAQYGGVFPTVAKREHQKNLVPLLKKALSEYQFLSTKHEARNPIQGKKIHTIEKILNREPELLKHFLAFIPTIKKPPIDAIAVTYGPGLEPALWVGISFAEALGAWWDIPVVPINHMEGHIVSVLFNRNDKSEARNPKHEINYPALALLISGGHTELVVSKKPLSYETIGKTRDDALGECYDKVARMMELPYPGGPEVSKLAESARQSKTKTDLWHFPRPMIYTKDFDFSFSGLKTSVLYATRKHGKLSQGDKRALAKEFEDAVTDVIMSKTRRAILKYRPKSLIVGGGVIANKHIRGSFLNLSKEFTDLTLHIPEADLATDNSVMIGMAGYMRILKNPRVLKSKKRIAARGQATLS